SVPVAVGTNPVSVTVDPSGRFAYVVNQGANTVSVLAINGTTGALTTVGAPIAAGTSPISISVEPRGQRAYVANFGSNNLSAFTIDGSTGALTALGTFVDASPVSAPYSISTSGVLQ
ncbi:MAG: beta-propeller fold lactonase family protein, partial [Nitrospirota bacterium]|nr:beta-propeller fold lactonase family protein [Nitrospirota bacterium]